MARPRIITRPDTDDLIVHDHDERYLGLAGGTLTGNPKVSGASPFVIVDTTTPSGSAHVELTESGARKALIYTTPGTLRIRRYANGSSTAAEIALYDAGYISTSVPVRVPATVAADVSTVAASKGYVDGYLNTGFVKRDALADQVMSGVLVIGITGKSSELVLDTKTLGNSTLALKRNGVFEGAIYGLSDNVTVRRQHSAGGTNTDLRIYDDYAHCNKRMSSASTAAADPGATLTTKDYVDARLVQQPAGYKVLMPSATPSVGQTLKVASVSGGVVTMGWF